jgi:cullin-associated NEDD8-dissociated protein 1
LAGDQDIIVRRYALESLTAITHVQPETVKGDIKKLEAVAIVMTKIDPSLIKEVDLGPFKHKIDDGIPIRKAAFGLLDTMVEKIPEKVDCSSLTEVAIRGLEDTAEECMIQCLSIIHRLVQWAPIIVVSQID